MRNRNTSAPLTVALLLSATACAINPCGAGGLAIVSPAGLADVEGNGEFILPAFDVLHQQQVYPAADFSSLGGTHPFIIQLALRTDILNLTPYTASSANVDVRLSTTAIDSLSPTFADNVGEDEMLVFSGPVVVNGAGSAPPGGPHPFDFLITFQSPFPYDPAQGNLLVELAYDGFVANPSIDVYTDAEFFGDGQNRLIAAFTNQTTAEFVSDGVDVAQFVFVPEPTALVLAGFGLFPLWLAVRVRRRQ